MTSWTTSRPSAWYPVAACRCSIVASPTSSARAADPALDDGARIAEAASGSALAAATIDLFGAFLGGFAGNVALTLGARGGVWIAGGIAPRLVDRLAASPFRDRFESKGRFKSYLEPIGTAIITRPDPALGGLAFAVEHGL